MSGRVKDSKARAIVPYAGAAIYILTESGKVKKGQKQSVTVKQKGD